MCSGYKRMNGNKKNRPLKSKTEAGKAHFEFISLTGGAILLVCVFGLLEITWETVMICVLIAAAAIVGFTLGVSRKSDSDLPVESHPEKDNFPEQHTSRSPLNSDPDDAGNHYLRGTLDELCFMQNSDNLLQRYQCFIKMIERALTQTLGPCSVSLWCPDCNYINLIECVIRDIPTSDRSSLTKIVDSPASRRPHHMPLDSPVISESLKTQQPYLAENLYSKTEKSVQSSGSSLNCDLCIPLYRDHGQPLLIVADCSGSRQLQNKNKSFQDEFDTTINLIYLFWNHLQATNQRQWLIEHDTSSGTLRDETFISKAQQMAKISLQGDEIFSVVVITVQGFRRMFAGQSKQWQQLTAVISRALMKILSEKCDDFLLGKMADDVFAIFLPRTNEFLAKSVMQTVTDRLADVMEKDNIDLSLVAEAVDIQWALSDQNHYTGCIQNMLEKIYRCLFTRAANKQKLTHRIVLARKTVTQS